MNLKELTAPSMAELKRRERGSGDSPPGELTALVDHWIHVTDEWVERLDEGMGGTAPKGADPAVACQPPDPLPGPRLGAG